MKRGSEEDRMDHACGRKAGLLVGACVAAVIGATPAWAQSASEGELDTLIVTAQRREESANDVGMGIQAVRGETLARLHVTDTKDLSAFAPSFTVSQSYQGVPTYTLRGIG